MGEGKVDECGCVREVRRRWLSWACGVVGWDSVRAFVEGFEL